MAYTLDHPLLVIVEENLRPEGLLETGYDWYIQRVNLKRHTFFDKEFVGVFADWNKAVDSFSQSKHSMEANLHESAQTLSVDTHQQSPLTSTPSAYILEKFYNVMLSAYPTKSALRRAVLFGMNLELDTIAGESAQSEVLLDLISWARQVGRFEELINVAYRYNPDNPNLKSFVLTTLGSLPNVPPEDL